MSNPQKGKQRPRDKGDPSWYDTSLAASANQEEEVMEIPRDKVGLVIGRQGRRVREIREQTGAQISIKDNKAHLRGTIEQREKARKIIEEVLNPTATGEGSSHRVGLKKLQNLLIPERLIGHVIGKGRENLNMIQTKTGVTLKVINNEFYIRASTEEKAEKLAVREIREIVSLWIHRFRIKMPFTRFVYVDAAQLEDDHEFQLKSLPLPFANSKEPCYKLQLLEHPLNEETVSGFTDVENLREKILEVLKQIHKRKGEDEVKVDMWCHFGHAYITKVDEEESEDTFTLKEIIEKIESADSNRWRPFFKEGVEEMEVQAITALPSQSTKEDIRHDFTFYTPSCRNVRVKAWLIEGDDGEQGSAESQSNMAFSASAPVPVKNILTRVSNEGEASSAPCFHICSQFHHRMKVDILMPAKGLDCRLSIRTCKNDAPKSPEDEEEDKILESYLMGMKIDKNDLTLPPTSQLQDGFDLYYQRRSLRKTYQYKTGDGEQFNLTVCKEQARNVDPCSTGTSSIDDIPAKTDIHLHCDEWDRVLDEGNWEPEQIVAKLPAFLQFLRSVQRNVSP